MFIRKFSSSKYWEKRYKDGGNSGAGSYGRLAEFKASFLNDFVKNNQIESVIEFGCGDGNQLKQLNFKKYIGLDVSSTILDTCIQEFKLDKTKSFFLYDQKRFVNNNAFSFDLAMSLDVIFHLVEDEVYEKYMNDLFSTAVRYVIVYSSNCNDEIDAVHVKHRKFSDWIESNRPEWTLEFVKENDFPLTNDDKNETFADFYVYKKITS